MRHASSHKKLAEKVSARRQSNEQSGSRSPHDRPTYRCYPPINPRDAATGGALGKLLQGGGSMDPRPERARHMLFAPDLQTRVKLQSLLMSRTFACPFDVSFKHYLELQNPFLTRFWCLLSGFVVFSQSRATRACFSNAARRHIHPYQPRLDTTNP